MAYTDLLHACLDPVHLLEADGMHLLRAEVHREVPPQQGPVVRGTLRQAPHAVRPPRVGQVLL